MAFRIEFARGDSYEKGLVVKNKTTKEPNLTEWDQVYFTVKKNFKDKDFVLQRTLGNGITSDGNGHFTLSLLPTDTNGLNFVEYDCDFEFVKGYYKRTFDGTLRMTKEVTHQYNEGGDK